MGGGDGNDVWGWADAQTGNEYALMGLTNGTAFVDVTDPDNPVFLGRLQPIRSQPHGATSRFTRITHLLLRIMPVRTACRCST